MIEIKGTGDILITTGVNGQPSATQKLKLYKNGELQAVVTQDQLLAAIEALYGETVEVTLADTSVLTFTNGILTNYEPAA